MPTGFFVFYRSVSDLVGATVVGLWRGCQHGFRFLPAVTDPQDSPGPSPVQLVKYEISFVFGVNYGTGWQDSAIGQAVIGSRLAFSLYFQLFQLLVTV